MVSINEIERINELEGDRIEGYEFVMLDGKRMLLDRRLIGRFADFKAAMHSANSAIRFGSQDERICYACRGNAQPRSDRCPECDAVIPGPPVVNRRQQVGWVYSPTENCYEADDRPAADAKWWASTPTLLRSTSIPLHFHGVLEG